MQKPVIRPRADALANVEKPNFVLLIEQLIRTRRSCIEMRIVLVGLGILSRPGVSASCDVHQGCNGGGGVAGCIFFQIRVSCDLLRITIYLTMDKTYCVCSPNSILIKNSIVLTS